MNYLSYLYKYLWKYQFFIFLSIIFALAYSFLNALFLSLIQPIFDRIIFFKTDIAIPNIQNKSKIIIWLFNYINSFLDFKDPITGLKQIAVIIFFVAVIKGIFYFLQYYLSCSAGQLTIRNIRHDLYKHLWTLPLKYFSNEHTGTLLSRFTFDMVNLEKAISKGIRDFFINIFQIIISFLILFGLDWKLTLAVIVSAPFILLPIVKLGNKMRTLTKKLQDKMADLNIILQETITGVRIVRAFNMEEKELEKFRNENKNYMVFAKKISRITSLEVPLVETLFTLVAVGILGYGGLSILNGHLTSGEFFMYFGILLSITPHIGVLSNVYGIFQAGIAGMEKIISIFEIEPYIASSNDRIDHILKKEISYNNVCFGYEPGKLILNNINITIKKGEIIAIVGPSGAGKTTMVDLLLNFYSPTNGKIEIDNIDIYKINLLSLRSQIGVVTQETFLFHDTVENNILYAKPEASFDEIKQACELANASIFINKMPDGFKTMVGERGTQLSGGERQRLSIARAILKNPVILILDEATSSLDIESERQVQKALNNLFSNRTTIIIAHRLSTIQHTDRIIVLDKGIIQDIGSHNELMTKSKLYKELYELQFIK